MIRTIDGFHTDGAGDWVAELSCLHNQHVRHQPPFRDRSWVLSEQGRADRLGSPIECPLCDRAELPEGLVATRVAGPFDETSLPAALRRDHRVADRTWGVLRVLAGRVSFEIDVASGRVELRAGDQQAIPPGLDHRVALGSGGRIEIEFLTRRSARRVPRVSP